MPKKTALYMRLSQDDGNEYESNSIIHQREILSRYAKEHNYTDMEEYVDDGFSGITFNRPGFLRMLQDINDDKIEQILVKDLSRFGRNNTMVVYYIDVIFSEFNVRLISVNDNLDTNMNGYEELIIPIRSVMNETYSKELSRKVRATYVHRALKGEWCGSRPPYGYIKHPTMKNRLTPHPTDSLIVKEMFRLADKGYSFGYIALILKIKTSFVLYRLSNPVYTGNTISRRYGTVSMKVHAKVPESEWIIRENTHEALVEQDVFDRVQKKLKYRRNELDNRKIVILPLYKGLLTCGLCGQPLSTGKQGKYKCQKCDGQITTEIRLNNTIMDELSKAKEAVAALLDKLLKLRNKESELRYDVKKAMECNIKGELTNIALNDVLEGCKNQRYELEEQIRRYEGELNKAKRLAKYNVPNKLTREVVMNIIEKITVHGNNKLEIKYRKKDAQ